VHDGSDESLLGAQGWYDNVIWVNPTNVNDVIVGGVDMYESLDGGTTWPNEIGMQMHADNHAIVPDPRFGAANRTVYFGGDGGMFKIDDLGQFTTSPPYAVNNNLGVTQFYGAAADPSTGIVVGGTQDNGTESFSPSTSLGWFIASAGDGGFAASDPSRSGLFYGEHQYLTLFRATNGGHTDLSFIDGGLSDANANALFIAPFVLDPNNPQLMLAGGLTLWRTPDATASSPTWTGIKTSRSGSDHVSAIAIAPGNSNIIWVGYEQGDVYKTTNGTSASPAWTQVAGGTYAPYVTRIAISPFDSNVVYVARGEFSNGGNVLKTTDGGATWTDASGAGETALPPAPVHSVTIDPNDPNTLYVGSEVGVFVSHDGGASWDLPQDGPANVCVDELFWMGSTLMAATHGRGVFAADAATAAPAFYTTPGQLDFGSQSVGSTSPTRGFVLTNSGGGTLRINSLGLSGGQASDFTIASTDCVGTDLAPNATCHVNVVFRPSASGARSAALVVTDTAIGSPHSVPLAGNGLAVSSTLPASWLDQDVGSVGLAGTASYSGGTFSVTGSGADIWGTADAFHYVYQPISGLVQLVARVDSVQSVKAWTKAGIMIRSSLSPSSPQVSLFVTPGKGIALQWRTGDGSQGYTSSNVQAAGTAPKWLRLVRTDPSISGGHEMDAAYSDNGVTWTTIGSVFVTMSADAYAGIVISSHDNSQLATTTVDHVSIGPATAPPSPWSEQDIGSTAVPGSAAYSSGVFTLKGSGADIWGTADAFHFLSQPLSGDGAIAARVATVQNVNAWVKTGVMLRATADPGSPSIGVYVTPGKGIAVQWRTAQGGTTLSQQVSGAAPSFVKLARAGNAVTASYSANGSTWTAITTVTISMPSSILAGLPISSHDNTQLASATLDTVVVTSAPPSPWSQQDIGSVAIAGSSVYSNGAFTLKGSGGDIWGTADAFHFVSQPLSGAGVIAARVASVQDVNAWVKTGVMLRTSADPGSPSIGIYVTAAKGIAVQWRSTQGGTTENQQLAGAAPQFVKLARAGNAITASYSTNGSTWTAITTVTISMPSSILAGLPICSHDNTQLASATLDTVVVQ
ncbi:MAG: choice-of-anchor D domain-containing protein, partial [Vicinamibacterales bacterium]